MPDADTLPVPSAEGRLVHTMLSCNSAENVEDLNSSLPEKTTYWGGTLCISE